MPTVWGSRAHSSNALPPLKSMSTNVRWSGSTLAARPATIDRSSSDLPEPVVPPTRAWGPSATKSTRNTPSSAMPTGVARRGSAPAAFHRASTASGVHSSSSSRGNSRIDAGRPAPTTSSSGSSNRARTRAQSRATSSAMPAGRNRSTRWPACGSVSSAPPSGSTMSTTVVHTAGKRSTVEAMTMPATRPASPRSRLRVGARRPSVSDSSSTTTSSVGPTGRFSPPWRSCPWRSRGPAARSRDSARRVDSSGSADSTRPTPVASRVWGSHLAQSQSAPASGRASTMTGRSAGPCSAAAWHSSERARASAAGRSPTMPTTPPADRSTGTGLPSSVAASASRSVSSAGVFPVRGGSATGGRHRTAPTPTRSRRKSRCAGRRSHSVVLGSVTRRTISAGSGLAASRRRRSPSARSTRAVCSSASSRAKRSRSPRSERRPRRLLSTALTIAMTGVRAENMRNCTCLNTAYISPANASGARMPRIGSADLPWPRLGAAGRATSVGADGSAGRGGRLKGMVPAAVVWRRGSKARGRS